ncbi:MAG: hypothetical protein JSW66_15375 [Phycisphaerales bacterium]|nr:MAG: hypothetical protein JSW66_15375 [Phycisphaerales bacterium]
MMPGSRNDLRAYWQPAFLICVLVLAAAGAGMSVAMKKLGAVFEKEPLPLKKSLELLDEADLTPFRVVPPKRKIENEHVLKALGTHDYIQWVIEDTEQGPSSPAKKCLLFVSYYRLPDRVPHVPEECWAGGGYQKLGSEGVRLNIDNNAGFQAEVPANYLVFGPKAANLWQSSVRIPNVYFFRVNGQYAGSREEARLALNKNLFGRHSYFCKVELVFNVSSVSPSKEEAVAAGEKLLAVVLPILEEEYWPDSENGKGPR